VLEHMAEMNAQRARSSDKSSAIFDHMKKRALEEIFNMMDSDADGVISAHAIEIGGNEFRHQRVLK
jgi:Ca2+-binding EF-hand superfamily protein